MNTVNITTPQNIEVEYELGSLGDRIAGAVIDWLIIIAYIVIIIITANFASFKGTGFNVIIFIFFLPVVFYDLLSEILLSGQSAGKKVTGIKVISLSGQQPSFSQYLIRWVFRLIDFTVTSNLLGLILVAATQKHQRLGDIIAGTVLVKTRQKTNADDTWYHPAEPILYNVTYPEVINLKDHDIQLIKEVITNVRQTGNTMLALQAQQKIEQILNISGKNNEPQQFLQTLLADYNYLTSQL